MIEHSIEVYKQWPEACAFAQSLAQFSTLNSDQTKIVHFVTV
jgi:hypothetical protein